MCFLSDSEAREPLTVAEVHNFARKCCVLLSKNPSADSVEISHVRHQTLSISNSKVLMRPNATLHKKPLITSTESQNLVNAAIL